MNLRTSRPRWRSVVASIAALSMGLMITACGSDGSEGDPNSARLLAGPLVTTLALPLVVKSLDLDAQYDVDLDVEATGTNETNMAAVTRGDVEFAFVTRNAAFNAAANGNDQIVIVASTVTSHGFACLLRPDVVKELGLPDDATGEDKLKALKGLTIATTSLGAGVGLEISRLLRKAGVDPEKDLTLVPANDVGAMAAGIKQKRFDGACYGVGALDTLVVAGDLEYFFSAAAGDFEGLKDLTIGGVIITSRRVLERSPQLVGKVYESFTAAEKELTAAPEAVAGKVYGDWFTEMPRPVFDVTWTNTLPVFPAVATFSRADFDTALGDVTSGDKDKIEYDTLIYKGARG